VPDARGVPTALANAGNLLLIAQPHTKQVRDRQYLLVISNTTVQQAD
jgi:hypothetical protein